MIGLCCTSQLSDIGVQEEQRGHPATEPVRTGMMELIITQSWTFWLLSVSSGPKGITEVIKSLWSSGLVADKTLYVPFS